MVWSVVLRYSSPKPAPAPKPAPEPRPEQKPPVSKTETKPQPEKVPPEENTQTGDGVPPIIPIVPPFLPKSQLDEPTIVQTLLTPYESNPFTIKVKSNIVDIGGEGSQQSAGEYLGYGPMDTYLNRLQFGARGNPRDPRFGGR